ncbi:MAG: uracil-DNA glycosylase [candidate division WOR-3 bacterium]|nr:MAG: uracil-DNA glycosylase [candidate division WOR-3 bacterium]
MSLQDLWDFFKRKIFTIPSSDRLFNQYKDRDKRVDLPDAAQIRRENLHNYFESFTQRPPVMVVGEAPGPWGCRFSGIPFTGERQLVMHELPFQGRRSSTDNPTPRIRKSTPYVSNSARIFWGTMNQYHPKFFVWNCVPIHPYKKGTILSVRTPTTVEVLHYSVILSEILSQLKPEKIIALGRKAEFSLQQLGIPCAYVRHPSQGGAGRFKKGIEQAFKKYVHNMRKV